jgi:simple sugar transport system ATP-binding protein
MVGDHMVLLNRGKMALDTKRDDITLDELTQQMAGGDELDALSHELRRGPAGNGAGGNGAPDQAVEAPEQPKGTV